MADVPPPRPGPLGLIQYAGVDMLQYAGEVSAAKDAEIAQLQADIEQYVKIASELGEQVRVLEDALRVVLNYTETPSKAYLAARAALEKP